MAWVEGRDSYSPLYLLPVIATFISVIPLLVKVGRQTSPGIATYWIKQFRNGQQEGVKNDIHM